MINKLVGILLACVLLVVLPDRGLGQDSREVFLSELRDTIEADIWYASQEMADYRWSGPAIPAGVPDFSTMRPSELAVFYLQSAQLVSEYVRITEEERRRLELHRGFWTARSSHESNSISIVIGVEARMDSAAASPIGLTEVVTSLKAREAAFTELLARYESAVIELDISLGAAIASKELFESLAQYHLAMPPGTEAFALSDVVRRQATDTSQLNQQLLAGQLNRRLSAMQFELDEIYRRMADEADRLGPLNDLQTLLTIVGIVVQTYELVDSLLPSDQAADSADRDGAGNRDTPGAAPPDRDVRRPDTTEPSRRGATGSWEELPAPIDELVRLTAELGPAPPATPEALSAMSVEDLDSYFTKIERVGELARSFQPTEADLFVERYKFTELDIDVESIATTTPAEAFVEFIKIVVRPQVVADGGLGSAVHLDDIQKQLIPHYRFMDSYRGLPNSMDMLTIPTFPVIEAGPVLRTRN